MNKPTYIFPLGYPQMSAFGDAFVRWAARILPALVIGAILYATWRTAR